MKRHVIIQIYAMIFLLIPATTVFAYVRMPVNSLQPIPRSVRPNVSGNVNTTALPASHANAIVTTSTPSVAPAEVQKDMLDAHSSSWGWFAAGLVLVTLLSALVGAGVWYFGFRLPE